MQRKRVLLRISRHQHGWYPRQRHPYNANEEHPHRTQVAACMEKPHEKQGERGQKTGGRRDAGKTPPQAVRSTRQRLHARAGRLCAPPSRWMAPSSSPKAPSELHARFGGPATPRSLSSERPPHGHAYRRNHTLHAGTQLSPAGARARQRGCAGHARTQPDSRTRLGCVGFALTWAAQYHRRFPCPQPGLRWHPTCRLRSPCASWQAFPPVALLYLPSRRSPSDHSTDFVNFEFFCRCYCNTVFLITFGNF